MLIRRPYHNGSTLPNSRYLSLVGSAVSSTNGAASLRAAAKITSRAGRPANAASAIKLEAWWWEFQSLRHDGLRGLERAFKLTFHGA